MKFSGDLSVTTKNFQRLVLIDYIERVYRPVEEYKAVELGKELNKQKQLRQSGLMAQRSHRFSDMAKKAFRGSKSVDFDELPQNEFQMS
mmetsp:Transcript_37318/g.57213  ORF Transcript_37318/g.57213 Transcript_37318/m.57213 type:complete len:89 (-) Transcript_37318:531-797(-)